MRLSDWICGGASAASDEGTVTKTEMSGAEGEKVEEDIFSNDSGDTLSTWDI